MTDFARLLPGGRRGLAQAFIRSGVERGITGGAIIRTLREAGLTYRRTVMLADIRTFRGITAVKPALQAIRKDFYPSERMYRSPFKFAYRKYSYDVRMRFFDPRKQETITQYTRISSDVPMRIMDIERQARDYFRPPADEYEFTDLNATIASAILKPEEEAAWTE